MEEESCVPPGFRFHPTEEELVGYYLARKVASQKIDLEVIQEVDLYRIEPWDLQERCKYGHEEQTEWYFFSYKDRKYPSGTRTNRATAAGFWKATGRDKPVLSRSRVIGMRKTLVFYKGRAPNGRKSDWIMHEYRLQTSEHAPTQEEGWVVCRAFQKPTPNQRPFFANNFSTPANYYENPNARLRLDAVASFNRPTDHGHFMDSYQGGSLFPQLIQYNTDCAEELESKKHFFSQAIKIPQLESPSLTSSGLSSKEFIEGGAATVACNEDYGAQRITTDHVLQGQANGAIDWNFLDSLLSSQFHEPAPSSNSPVD